METSIYREYTTDSFLQMGAKVYTRCLRETQNNAIKKATTRALGSMARVELVWDMRMRASARKLEKVEKLKGRAGQKLEGSLSRGRRYNCTTPARRKFRPAWERTWSRAAGDKLGIQLAHESPGSLEQERPAELSSGRS